MESELNLKVVIDHDANLPFAHASDLTAEITRRVRDLLTPGGGPERGFYEVEQGGGWGRDFKSGPVTVTLRSAFLSRQGG